MSSTPRTEEEEDEYELTLLGKVVIPLGELLVRHDGGTAPTDFRGWSALVGRLVRRHLVLLVGTVVALVVAAAIVVYFATRTTPPPSTTAAARLVLAPPQGPPPAVASADYLALSYNGVRFPNYQSMHAVATGQLSKAIDGRPAMTVFYRLQGGQRLSYTVFSGAPTHPPARASLDYFDTVGLRVYRTHGLTVITTTRHGRTTVTASSAPLATLLTFAAAPVLKDGGNQANSGCAVCG
jgi:hypothetical protein